VVLRTITTMGRDRRDRSLCDMMLLSIPMTLLQFGGDKNECIAVLQNTPKTRTFCTC
jgi:hypothetical protein